MTDTTYTTPRRARPPGAGGQPYEGRPIDDMPVGMPRALTAGVLGRRLEAWLIDSALIVVASAAAWLFCLTFGTLTFGFAWPLFSLLPALPFIYSVAFLLSPLSATPGQWLRGIAVRRVDDLGPPELWQAVVATIGYYVTLATSGFLIVVSLVTRRHRALHDIAAGLVLVRRRALDPLVGHDRGFDPADRSEPPLTSFGVASNMSSRSWPH